jgi:hypothetical protein
MTSHAFLMAEIRLFGVSPECLHAGVRVSRRESTRVVEVSGRLSSSLIAPVFSTSLFGTQR